MAFACDLKIARGVFELLLLSDEPASHSSKISFKQFVPGIGGLDGDGIVLYGFAIEFDDEDDTLIAGIDIVDDSVMNLISHCPRLGRGLPLSTDPDRISFRLPVPACPRNFSLLLSLRMILIPAIPSISPTFGFKFLSASIFSFFSRSATSVDKRSWTVMLMRPSDRDPRRFRGDEGSCSSSSSSSSATIEHLRFLPF